MNDRQQSQFTFSVSLTPQAHELASKFCEQYIDIVIAEKIYFNTLAIYAVNHYLRCLDFETECQGHDSYKLIISNFLDTAYLIVKNYGKLECRYIFPHDDFVCFPRETWASKVGYVVVQFDELLQTATLIGFAKSVIGEEVPLSQLTTLLEFPQYLQQCHSVIDLNEWLEGFLQAGWQTLDSLLNNELLQNLNLCFKDTASLQQETIKAVKQIMFNRESVILAMVLSPESNQQLNIKVRVYPDSKQSCLPKNLKLAILNDTGETLLVVTSRSFDNFIQLPRFKCNPQDSFVLQVSLDDISYTERFCFTSYLS
ncbi:DUF1822 family protein [Calothrix sp. NIES-3974]|uniref:DUF1822 family protein n=1 Tax=Calothrix sp. NIES-3974 TaxID=2005462 RepID=UPI000B61E19A|nr:DUF1822 family protein [Calothrix sp. NIES-3974]BAZ06610.1 hypothetical protein NIES3974_32710 [Calothrix sp. NIES-3974]